MLDLSPLEKALNSLNRAIVRAVVDRSDEELRDATIQRFEYSFELCWKMLKRRLEADSPHPGSVDAMSFRELIREGHERGYIRNPEDWFLFRDHRNTVAHTYNESKAKIVFETALQFEKVAQSLLASLKAGNRD